MKLKYRKRLLKSSILISRSAFSILVILLCLTPTLKDGLFPHISLASVDISGKSIPIGIEFLLSILILGGYLVRWVFSIQRPQWHWGQWTTTVPVLGFGFVAIIRSWPVHEPSVALVSVSSIVIFWAVYFFVLQLVPRRWILNILSIILVVQGLFGLVQFLIQRSMNLPFTCELSLDPNVRGISVIEAADRRWLRAYGLTPHPNFLGGYLGICLLLCMGSLIHNPRKMWLWLGVGVGGCAFFFSFSRSAWLGLVLSLIYFVLVLRPWMHIRSDISRIRLRLFAAFFISVMIVGALSTIYWDLLVSRIFRIGQTLEANSIQERIRDAGQAWMLIRHSPLRGVGTGYYVQALWAWANTTGREFPAFQPVHNIPLLVTAEMGITGVIFWLWLILAPPIRFIYFHRQDSEPLTAAWVSSFLLLFVVSLLDNYLYLPKVWWSSVYLGLLLSGWERSISDLGIDIDESCI